MYVWSLSQLYSVSFSQLSVSVGTQENKYPFRWMRSWFTFKANLWLFFAAFILLKSKQSKIEWVTKPDKSKQIEVEREKNIGNNSLITVTPESYTLWMDQYFNWGMCRYYYNDDLHLRQFLLLFFFSRKQTLS